jgi:hypothetical protein
MRKYAQAMLVIINPEIKFHIVFVIKQNVKDQFIKTAETGLLLALLCFDY